MSKKVESPEYVDNDFYLPLPGCPLLSSLDPERTDKLTLRGNRAKMIRIGMWASMYATSRFLIDDQTGEIYKVLGDDLALIREFGVLNEEEARKQFQKSSPSSIRKSEEDKQDLIGPSTGAIPKTTHTSEGPEEQPKQLVEDTENPPKRYEQEQEERRAALKDYQDYRTVRRNKELELIGRSAVAGKDQVPTKAEMDKVRMEIERKYQSCLRKENDALKRYYDKCPSELDSDEDDVSSQVSMKSYQAEDSWTEEKYRKILLKHKRMEAHYTILQHARDISVQRHPENPTLYNKELAEAREQLDKRQEKGKRLLEIAKMGANFQRSRGELLKQAIEEERSKWEQAAKEEYQKNQDEWTQVTKERFQKKIDELIREQQQEKKEWESLNQQKEEKYSQLLIRYQQEQEAFKRNEELKEKMIRETAQEKREWEEQKKTWEKGLSTKDQRISKLEDEYITVAQERTAHLERLSELRMALDKEQKDQRQSLQNLKQTMDQERAVRQESMEKAHEAIVRTENEKTTVGKPIPRRERKKVQGTRKVSEAIRSL